MAEEYYEEAFIGEQFFEEESFEDFWPSDTPQSEGSGGSAQSYNLSVNCIIDTSGYHGSYITEGHSTGWNGHTWGVTPTYSSVSGKFPFLAGDKVSIEKVSFQYAGGNNWFLSDGGCAE